MLTVVRDKLKKFREDMKCLTMELDKASDIIKALFFQPKLLIFFLFLHKKICFGYSLEEKVLLMGTILYVFMKYKKKTIMLIPPLILSHVRKTKHNKTAVPSIRKFYTFSLQKHLKKEKKKKRIKITVITLNIETDRPELTV